MCIVRERRPAGFLDMKCQTCFGGGGNMLCSLRVMDRPGDKTIV